MPTGRPPKDPGKKVTAHEMKYPWSETTVGGWQWEKPDPDPNWHENTKAAWDAWFSSWWAAHYELEDLPALRQVGDLFDTVQRDGKNASLWSRLQAAMKAWGLTPEGRTSNRWLPPKDEPNPRGVDTLPDEPKKRLRVVG